MENEFSNSVERVSESWTSDERQDKWEGGGDVVKIYSKNLSEGKWPLKKVNEDPAQQVSALFAYAKVLSFTTRAIGTCNRERFRAGSPSRVHATSVYVPCW